MSSIARLTVLSLLTLVFNAGLAQANERDDFSAAMVRIEAVAASPMVAWS